MNRWLASAGVGASLLVLTGAAYADGYSAPRGYERPFSWTGFYIGAQGGSGWGTSEESLTSLQACVGGVCGPVTPFTAAGLLRDSYTINGFHGGGTAGYNLQTGPVVLGVEGDISAANIDGGGSCTNSFGAATNTIVAPPPTFSAHCRTSLDWFATLTGRLGVASGNALVYAKAGVAWGGFNRDVQVGTTALGPGGVIVLRGSTGN